MLKVLLCGLVILSFSANAETLPLPETKLHLTFPKEKKVAPDFSLPLLNGTSVSLADLKGHVVLLNFWATFCHPCREEMPALQSLWERYKDQGLMVIAVSVDYTNIKFIQKYMGNNKLTFPAGLDVNKNIRKKYEIKVLPTTYIIGRDGKFLARTRGERNWASTESFSYFKNLLEP